jgi:hypothetical protein
MKVNPKQLIWQAPTTNVDGTPIDYALNYEVGLSVDGKMEPLMVVPGQLQGGGEYTAPIADLGLAPGRVYAIALRSFAKEQPARKSAYSGTVKFAISERIPSAPFMLPRSFLSRAWSWLTALFRRLLQ